MSPRPYDAGDPVLVRRARYAAWSAAGLRAGYLLIAVAVVAFLIGFSTGLPEATVVVTIVALVAACVVLPPAIVTGFAVKAAEREDRSRRDSASMASRLHPPRPSASRLPAARRRRQLLDVAVDTFAARGFHGTSMDDLAEAAGVTKPVVYQHFPSKRRLYLELLEDVGSRLVSAVTGAVAAAAGPRQQVEAGFAAYFRFVARQTSAFTLLFGSGGRRDEEFAEEVRKVEDRMADSVAGLIEADIAADHREVLGYGIVGLAETTARHWVSGAGQEGRPPVNDEEAARLARRIAELAWAGLRGVHRD